MSENHSLDDLNKHIKIYIGIFVALLILTGVTVWVSYLDLSRMGAIAVAMAVALTKGTLVVGFFMHVFDEFKESKPVLFWTLVASVFMFAVLLIIPILNYYNRLGQ
jgi:caa(3)-type oxidase subunit IV